MAVIDRIKPVLAVIIFSILLAAAGCSGGVKKNAGVSLWKGTTSFEKHYNELSGAKGILPPSLDIGTGNASIIRISPVNFYEYFAYDEKTTLLVLSLNPFYYIKIESREFKFHLDNEYGQFAANPALAPSAKQLNTTTGYKLVGDSRVALYFTPTEIQYTTSGINKYRIKDANSISSVDMWKLLDAAEYAALYTPVFEEQKLFSDLHTQVQAGKKRLIYTRESSLTPKNYSILGTSPLNFTFAAGKDLSLTADILGTESEFFIDRVEMTRDFMFFFSTPLGNAAEQKTKDYLNIRHGIALQIRGDIENHTEFLADEGINFDPNAVSFLSIMLSENGASQAVLTANWFETRDVQVWYSFDGEIFTKDEDVIAASSHQLSATVARGKKVWIRLISPSSGLIMAEDSKVISRPPVSGELLVTEIMWMGTYDTEPRSYDEFVEIKNNTSDYLNLANVNIYNQQTKDTSGIPITGTKTDFVSSGTLSGTNLAPGAYFLVINYTDYLFSTANLNPPTGTYFAASSVGFTNPGGGYESTVYIFYGTDYIDSAAYTSSTGVSSTGLKKSAVRLSAGSIGTSANDVNIGDFTGKTYCSPGYGAAGEK